MSNKEKVYTITSRYFDDGWHIDKELTNPMLMETAWHRASSFARKLDEKYGDSHFWTVTLDNENDEGGIVQLFHGRLI
jgi:hypothetical protein